MSKFTLNPFAINSDRQASKRRPTGISRRQKRRLQFETLEDRRVMSVNPISAGLSEADVVVREIMLDDSAITDAFDRVSDLSRYSQEELYSTTEWVVLADEATVFSHLAAEVGFEVVRETGIIPGSYIIDTGGNNEDLIASLSGNGAVDYFYPSISLGAITNALPNDPLLADQWHLINFGQQVGGPGFQFIRGVPGEDINVKGAWDAGVTGAGVQIGIVDDGVLFDHPDLEANIREDLAVDILSGGGSGSGAGSSHGTSVAGLAAGVGDNGIGITGVAYEADIVPIRLLPSGGTPQSVTDLRIAQALLYQFQEIDVYNHSWGLTGETERTIVDFGPLSLTALRNSVFFGRGGLGAIHVWAAGNSGASSTSSQYDGLVNSRYTIGVTVVDHDGVPANVDGTVTSYPEGGANVLIAAPSASSSLSIIRDTNLGSGITTTDLPGDFGGNSGPDLFGLEIDNDFLFDENIEGNLLDYRTRFGGTSAAAPLVSGTIALMLQVNPDLSYRDVQHILVRTARQPVENDLAWITNLREFQLDPLSPIDQGPFNPDTGLGPLSAGPWIGNPFLVPRLPNQFTNGAGFTVNQGAGSYGDFGLGHGVINASAAVQMARTWETVGNQQSELTWTTGNSLAGKIWGHHISSDETGRILVPGGHAGDGDSDKTFPSYYDQFGDETPFIDDMGVPDDDPPFNDRDLGSIFTGHPGISIAGMPSMAVEWVEVQLDLGAATEDLDYLRVTLVSPDGTNSELNVFGQIEPNGTDHFDGISSFGPSGGDLGTTNLILSTNRHWGERTEAKPRVDDAGAPITDFTGVDVVDGWRLVFENYGSNEININTYNVTFHGVGIDGTSRIQGSLGVDFNGDTFFSADPMVNVDNYTRYVLTPDPFGGPIDVRSFNPNQEPFAGGVIVYADINQDGDRDSTEPFFETGLDGNYYFDLPPATYDLRIDGTALPEGLNNDANILAALGAPFTTVTISDVGNRYTPAQMPGVVEVAALNYLMTPDDPVTANTFSISGVVFADLNADGIQDGDDGLIGDVELYMDINQNGVFDPLVDPETVSAADGTYTLTTNPILPAITGFYSVYVVEGTTGAFSIATNPTDLEQAAFAELGDDIQAVDFGFSPVIIDDPNDPGDPNDPDPPVDPNTPGAIAGVVFVDANGSGAREGEVGAGGVTVYLDADGDGNFDVGEEARVTGANGSYFFNSLLSATYVVRIETPAGFEQTAPASSRHTVALQPGQGAIGRDFGVRSLAVNDWGDLPAAYNLTLDEDNGARHFISPIFFLGTIDGELDGIESADATGDDNFLTNDEDGIAFDELNELTTSLRIVATANASGGAYLRAWMDFNGDFDFDDPGEIVTFDPVVGDNLEPDGSVVRKLLLGGANELFVNVPSALLAANTIGVVHARFRYGEFETEAPTGAALIGEVEDYAITIEAVGTTGGATGNGADFDTSGRVDGFDFFAWQRGFGSIGAAPSQGDATDDGVVNTFDLDVFLDNYGNNTSGALAAASSEGGSQDAPLTVNEEVEEIDSSFLSGLILTVSTETAIPVTVAEEALVEEERDLLFADFAPLSAAINYDGIASTLTEELEEEEELEFSLEDQVFELLGS